MTEEFMQGVLSADLMSVIMLAVILLAFAVVTGVGAFGVVAYRLLALNAAMATTNAGLLKGLHHQGETLSKQSSHLETVSQGVRASIDETRASREVVLARFGAQDSTLNRHQREVIEALGDNQRAIMAEFVPVVKQLSAIGLGVDTLNKAILEHRQNEMKIMQVLQTEQMALRGTLVDAEKTLEAIFNKLMEVDDGQVTRVIDGGDVVGDVVGIADGGGGSGGDSRGGGGAGDGIG